MGVSSRSSATQPQDAATPPPSLPVALSESEQLPPSSDTTMSNPDLAQSQLQPQPALNRKERRRKKFSDKPTSPLQPSAAETPTDSAASADPDPDAQGDDPLVKSEACEEEAKEEGEADSEDDEEEGEGGSEEDAEENEPVQGPTLPTVEGPQLPVLEGPQLPTPPLENGTEEPQEAEAEGLVEGPQLPSSSVENGSSMEPPALPAARKRRRLGFAPEGDAREAMPPPGLVVVPKAGVAIPHPLAGKATSSPALLASITGNPQLPPPPEPPSTEDREEGEAREPSRSPSPKVEPVTAFSISPSGGIQWEDPNSEPPTHSGILGPVNCSAVWECVVIGLGGEAEEERGAEAEAERQSERRRKAAAFLSRLRAQKEATEAEAKADAGAEAETEAEAEATKAGAESCEEGEVGEGGEGSDSSSGQRRRRPRDVPSSYARTQRSRRRRRSSSRSDDEDERRRRRRRDRK